MMGDHAPRVYLAAGCLMLTVLATLRAQPAGTAKPAEFAESAESAESAGSAESVRVRVEFSAPDEVWVGQQFTFYVEVMTSTSFAENPRFDLPQVSGAVFLKPQMFPLTANKSLDGVEYSVQSHQFAIFAQRAGEIVVPPIGVRVFTGAKGAAPTRRRLKTDALRFKAKLPPGAEKLAVLVSTSDLQVRESWEPTPGDAKVGAAFTRTVTWQAPDVMGLAFPPLPATRIGGLAVYRREPVVRDRISRGQITGERQESITYVCEEPGEYKLPALVIPWFDLDEKTIRRIRLPAVTIKIAATREPGRTEGAEAVAPESSGGTAKWIVLAGVLLLLCAGSHWLLRRRLAARLRECRRSLGETESAYFARLRTACRADDPVAALNALLRWLDRRSAGPEVATIAAFSDSQNDPALTRGLQSLEQAVATGSSWCGRHLATELDRVRRTKSRRRPVERPSLPPLNPV